VARSGEAGKRLTPPVTVDGALVGAWTRSRLVVDGAPCRDRCRVLWLQTIDWYADMRVPSTDGAASKGTPEAIFARPWAFAGAASWDPPVMTWRHHLDSMWETIVDSNRLDRQRDLLVESGHLRWAGLAIPFREEWRRISRPDDEIFVHVDTNRIELTIGTRRIMMEEHRPRGPFRASQQDFVDGVWRVTASLLEPGLPMTRNSAYPIVDSRSNHGTHPHVR
jgi:hypothetical protein